MKKVQWRKQILGGICSLAAAFVLALTMDPFSVVSHAQSDGKAIVDAKIRLEASADSEAVGGVQQDGRVSINGQVMGADGNIWYQVIVNADTLGYVRSDLVQITDGSTPNNLGGNTASVATVIPTSMTNSTTADVTEVNPVSATVSGGQAVRVRSAASTSSDIVTTVQSGTALTVTGQTDGADDKVWYQVNFTLNGSEVVGFIRSDYVVLSEELTPIVEEPPAEPEPEVSPEPEPELAAPVEKKTYDTQYASDIWQLIDNTDSENIKVYDLVKVLEAANAYTQAEKTIKTQKIIMIILVVVIVLLAMVTTLIFFKMKDMSDSAYFAEVEREAARRTNSGRSQNGGQRTSRPQGQGAPRQGGSRPQSGASQGSRQTQGSGRPVQGRPQSAQGGRPSQGEGRSQNMQGGRSVQGEGRRQNVQGGHSVQGEGRPQNAQGGRPIQGEGRPQNMQGGRLVQEGRRQDQARQQSADNAQRQGWKSKNFMADEEDEFEFEYLNWDGEEDQ
ncbi:MAG: SH3 domain-containing protein [Candidatus Gastranaerophilales bacterium]|nr:SH3 domain-containing protein [Candidatus Gastranaerophilales bacterium]